MKARITLVSPSLPDSNPLSPCNSENMINDERELVQFDLEVSCLQEAREYYDQAVVLDFPSVRGLLLRSIEEVPKCRTQHHKY